MCLNLCYFQFLIVLHKLFVCFLHYNIVIDLIKNLVSAALSMLFNTIDPVRYRLCYVSKSLYRTSLYQILMCSVQHNFTELTVFVPPGYNYCIKYQRNLYRTCICTKISTLYLKTTLYRRIICTARVTIIVSNNELICTHYPTHLYQSI